MGFKIRHIGSPGSYYKSSEAILVDVNSEKSLNTWSNALSITKKELVEAVRKYGPNVKDIRHGLKESESPSKAG